MPTFRLVIASAKYGSQKIKSLSVEMEGHRSCAKKQQNLVPGAWLACSSHKIPFRFQVAA
jgi:hypothetical protein